MCVCIYEKKRVIFVFFVGAFDVFLRLKLSKTALDWTTYRN